MRGRELWVLGCSATKSTAPGELPAVARYDGPTYRTIRNYLRSHSWPNKLSIAILSAKHGLVGALTPLENYNVKMSEASAARHRPLVTETLLGLGERFDSLLLILGANYLPAIDRDALRGAGLRTRVVEGMIGQRLNFVKDRLHKIGQCQTREPVVSTHGKRPLYFLPDWDDFLDPKFDFDTDEFSAEKRSERGERHSIELMRPRRICDGVLVSLAQHSGAKGLLRRGSGLDDSELAPKSVRHHFGLHPSQLSFGDCGAFSYVNEDKPTMTVQRAVALYELFGFDLGASVDHIPVPVVRDANGRKRELGDAEMRDRVRVTRRNAARFIQQHEQVKATFIPVGVIQGLTPEDYADQLKDYRDWGYEHIALGGLVPRSDAEIARITELVRLRLDRYLRGWKPWLHLFGVYRPKIQQQLRASGVNSFDSATYFRKAWLRSDQNYLGTDGKWYAAIRVPPTSDPRTAKRLEAAGVDLRKARRMEREALRALDEVARGMRSVDAALISICAYDALLDRGECVASGLMEKYRRTLEAKPWESCDCPMCRQAGIHALVFRGLNRNKRRGAHNTLMMYESRNNAGNQGERTRG